MLLLLDESRPSYLIPACKPGMGGAGNGLYIGTRRREAENVLGTRAVCDEYGGIAGGRGATRRGTLHPATCSTVLTASSMEFPVSGDSGPGPQVEPDALPAREQEPHCGKVGAREVGDMKVTPNAGVVDVGNECLVIPPCQQSGPDGGT